MRKPLGKTGDRAYQNPVLVGVVLLAAGVSVAMIQYKVPTIMGDLRRLFAMSAESASWLMSVFTLTSVFVALPSGLLAKRFGPKTMMVAALGIAVAGSVVGLAAGSSAVLIASRAVEGAALTILTTCGPLIARACVRPEKMGTVMGIWGIWGCLGSTVAAVVVPTVFELRGFAGVWTTFAVCAVFAAVLVLCLIRSPAALAISSDAEMFVHAEREKRSSSLASCLRALLSRDVLLFFGGFAVFNVCLLAVLAYVPTILQMRGVDVTMSGFISTAPMLLSVVSSPLFGVLSDRTGHCKPLLVATSLVMGPCTLALYAGTGVSLWLAVVVMGVVGMGGVGLFLSTFVKLLPRPELASFGMGIMVMVQGVGQFLGTFLVQILLGPDLANEAFAGGALMALGVAGTVLLAACRIPSHLD